MLPIDKNNMEIEWPRHTTREVGAKNEATQ